MSSAENGISFDAANVQRMLETIVRNRVAVKPGLKTMAEFWQRQGADLDLEGLLEFPLTRELHRLEDWFGTVWSPKGPPVTSDGLWFGLIPLPKSGFDLYAAVLPRHGREPVEWDWSSVKYAKPKNASSRLLKTVTSPQGLVRDATARRHLGLGCAVLLAQHLCHALRPSLGAREPLVAAGYEDGEYFILGTARVNGRLDTLPPGSPLRPRSESPRGNILRLSDSSTTTRWILEQPKDGKGREVSRLFAQHARPIEADGPFEVPVYLKGRRLDFSFTLSNIPVVRRLVAELIEQADREAVQRLPATIEGVSGEFEILNVLVAVRPQKLLEQSRKAKQPPGELSLGKHRIARMKSMLLVTRELAESLIKAGVSGISFLPLKTADLE